MRGMSLTGLPELELEERACPVCGGSGHDEVARGEDYEYCTCSNVFAFVRCRGCGTVYLNPRPRKEDLRVIYPETYYSAVEAAGEGGAAGPAVRAAWDLVERRRCRQILRLLGDEAPAVLDVGCGDGRLLRLLRRLGPSGLSLVGVEAGLPRSALERAARQGIALHEGLYEEVSLPPESFDVVVAQQVIEHTLDPGAVLEKIRGELRPGGRAVLDMPSFDALDRRLFRRSSWGGYHFPRHMTLFTAETFARLARDHGFEVVSASHLASPVFWITSLHNVGVRAGLPAALTSRITYRSLPLLAAATALEVPALLGLRASSNLRVVLRKPAAAGGQG